MGLFSRKKKQPLPSDLHLAGVQTDLPPIDPAYRQTTSSYIEIRFLRDIGYDVVIRGGNHKMRYGSAKTFSPRNARRAAKLLSEQTGLKIVDRSK